MKNISSSKRKAQSASGKTLQETKGGRGRPDEPGISITSESNVLSNRPGYLVRRLHQLAVSLAAQTLAPYDLTPVQYGVLATVCAWPGIDQVSTAEAVGIDRTTIVSVIDRLERKGLITRSVAPFDKRMRLLEATESGQEILEQLSDSIEQHRLSLLEPLSQAESALFVEMMKRIIDYRSHG